MYRLSGVLPRLCYKLATNARKRSELEVRIRESEKSERYGQRLVFDLTATERDPIEEQSGGNNTQAKKGFDWTVERDETERPTG